MRSPDGPVVARMAFPVGVAKFSGADAEQLRALAKRLETNDTRLQVQGYASGGSAESPSGARRLSLLRALEVRSYLIEQGIKGTRIDVRALGAPPDGVQDRVDIISLAP
jgi:outer membrane protein OmpA-like peptidoglycan-associated protein